MLVNHTTPSLVKLLPGVLIRVDRRARLTPGSAIGIIGVLIRRVACNVGQRADAVLSVVQVVIGGLRSSRLLDAVTAIVVLELHAARRRWLPSCGHAHPRRRIHCSARC